MTLAEEHALRRTDRPRFEGGRGTLAVVDLFAGCGGLTLGAAQAALAVGRSLDVRLAVDFESGPLRVYKANFPAAKVRQASVEDLVDGPLGHPLTPRERDLRSAVGPVDLLVGGPPCQGHSNLNNHTRRTDPKNHLYLRMARAAEVLQPRAVLIENVPAVVHDASGVVGQASAGLEAAGFEVAQEVLELIDVGVAQRRRRHVLLAVPVGASRDVSISAVLRPGDSPRRTLRWAIGDLATTEGTSFVDTPPRSSPENLTRMKWMLDHGEYDLPNELRPRCHQGNHSYVSMYGRLRWTAPAQTLTSGFGSIGQGRYMHPDKPRALTAHEAARIQGFPDFFRFEAARTRSELSVIIGNAVPPQLSESLVTRLFALQLL